MKELYLFDKLSGKFMLDPQFSCWLNGLKVSNICTSTAANFKTSLNHSGILSFAIAEFKTAAVQDLIVLAFIPVNI